jgi:hypothetical protein
MENKNKNSEKTIMSRIRKLNSPNFLNEENKIIAKIIDVRDDINYFGDEIILIELSHEGTAKPINLKVELKPTISNQKFFVNTNGKKKKGKNEEKKYTRLTRFCLATGILSENELIENKYSIEGIDTAITELKECEVTCNLIQNQNNFWEIDIDTIKICPTAE